MANPDKTNPKTEIVPCRAEDQAPRIEVRLGVGTVWLSQSPAPAAARPVQTADSETNAATA